MTALPAILGGQFRLLKVVRLDPLLEREVRAQSLLLEEKAEEAFYFVLSYAWGAASPTRSITINRQPLEVTVNLWSALMELYRRGEIRDAWH